MQTITDQTSEMQDSIVTGRRTGAIRVVLALLALSIIANGVLGWKAFQYRRTLNAIQARSELSIGTAVPPIRVRGLTGEPTTVTFLGGDKATVLYALAPGCDACEMN